MSPRNAARRLRHFFLLLPATAAAQAPVATPVADPLHWPLTALLVLALLACLYRLRRARRAEAAARTALGARAEQLERAEQRLTAHFQFSPIPLSLSVLDDGRYLKVNPAWEAMSGWSSAEAVGRSSVELGLWLDPSDRERLVRELAEGASVVTRQIRLRMRDGSLRDVLYNGAVLDDNGRLCLFGAFIDLTEQLAAQAGLRTLNEALEARVAERTQGLETANRLLAENLDTLQRTRDELVQAGAMASLGRTVAGISHELNTPVSNARTANSTLADRVHEFREDHRAQLPARESLDIFLDDLEYGTRVTGHGLARAEELISSFKQVATDQTSERRRTFVLDTLVNDVLNTLRPMLRPHPYELHVRLDQQILMDSYPGPLGQVITNLVNNALHHGFQGRNHGTLRVSALSRGESEVEILVEDNGEGIAREHLPRLFDPFFTTRLDQGGSGLGLTIARRLVMRTLGGSLEVSSDVGHGASFRVRLPRVAPEGSVADETGW
ncbi:MAG: ATP-binding protein [Candidatus Dactylopiibacterium sp.]|nr:ATP-binding protein [Candidatus Dactylopiibacterium sp.]